MRPYFLEILALQTRGEDQMSRLRMRIDLIDERKPNRSDDG